MSTTLLTTVEVENRLFDLCAYLTGEAEKAQFGPMMARMFATFVRPQVKGQNPTSRKACTADGFAEYCFNEAEKLERLFSAATADGTEAHTVSEAIANMLSSEVISGKKYNDAARILAKATENPTDLLKNAKKAIEDKRFRRHTIKAEVAEAA